MQFQLYTRLAIRSLIAQKNLVWSAFKGCPLPIFQYCWLLYGL